MSEFPPADPASLAGFPSIDLHGDHTLFRVHHVNNEAAWFSCDGTGRFDPPPGSRNQFGACYTAETRLGAFVEKFGRVRAIPADLIEDTALTELHVTASVTVADLTQRTVLGDFGITADLSTSADYTQSQLWAGALRRAGFAGVRYFAKHDPAVELVSIALFGGPGVDVALFESAKCGEIPQELTDEAAAKFHIMVIGRSVL